MIQDIDISDEVYQAELLGNLLYDMYQPRKVIDVGCNDGMYLSQLLARGCEVRGYDYKEHPKPQAPITVMDITRDTINDRADLAICLEVLEHIPADLSLIALNNLLGVSDKIVFSAAQPGAGGVGHINCMPKEFWRGQIEDRGFEYCPIETDFIVKRMNKPGVMGWLLNNVMVFRKRLKYPYVSKVLPTLHNTTAVVTSCGRFDLLKKSLDSFEKHSRVGLKKLIISDDSEDKYQHDLIINHFGGKYEVRINGKNRGQAENLDSLYDSVDTEFLLHMEDDWEFIASGWDELSYKVLNSDPKIGFVQLDLKPDYFKFGAVGKEHKDYFEYNKWRISDKHLYWHGWAGSPRIMRMDMIRKLGSFSAVNNEVQYDINYSKSGYRTVWAKRPYVRHIGYGRSTMGGYEWVK